MAQQYEQINQASKNFATKMRNGTGVSSLLTGQNAPTHYIDALQRFQKDYATYERQQRQKEKMKRQEEIEKKRIQKLERENKRWEIADQEYVKNMDKIKSKAEEQRQGVRRTATSNGLPYNPINLEYDKNPQGEKLKTSDEDQKIRGFVRAHNMQHRGNSKFNLLTGQDRMGIEKIVPSELDQRYKHKLNQYYSGLSIRAPSSKYPTISDRKYI